MDGLDGAKQNETEWNVNANGRTAAVAAKAGTFSENPCDIHVKHLEFCEFRAYFANGKFYSFVVTLYFVCVHVHRVH